MKNVNTVIDKIKNLASAKESVFIAIDGPGGAGKSTLTKHIQNTIPEIKVIKMDYYYDPVMKRTDYIRVKNELLLPLKRNQPASSKIYDWPHKRYAEAAWIEPGGIFLFEGWYSMEKNLAEYYDYRIWVDCPAEIGMKRGLQRDNGYYKDTWKNVWLPAMNSYITLQHPVEKADIIIPYLTIPRLPS